MKMAIECGLIAAGIAIATIVAARSVDLMLHCR